MKQHLTSEAIERLLAWYDSQKRDLPWRHTSDPYRIWLSEIMLQQTRVEAVKPYYARFLETCPDIASLAELSEERLYKLWEGLGYYSRVRNLQKAARTVMEQYGGSMPRTYEKLRKLSGIGDYTAGAIASIAYGERVPAIDGNVLRVLARLCALREDIADPKTKAAWRERLAPLVPERAGDFTQAMIELGATVCVPNGEPKCRECPLKNFCDATKQGLTDEIPVRSAKKPRRIEDRTVLIVCDENRIALGKRPPKGLLAGLFEFPNVTGHLSESEALQYLRSFGFDPVRIERIEDSKHIFTHVEWRMIAYRVRITPEFDGQNGKSGLSLIDIDDVRKNYAIPSAFSAYTRYLSIKP
ncbi:MAG: A/G-specific adenine glycosylase [Clostridia bacterium]|nr:A/G-specific adenine glycosylase [Clostridia bacterium]